MIERETKKKEGSFLTKIISIILFAVALITGTIIAVEYLKNRAEQPGHGVVSDQELIGLSDEYSTQQEQDDLSDLTVNEMREKGAEFIYQTLLKNQIKIEDLQAQLNNLKNEVHKYRSQERLSKMVVTYVELRDKILAGKNYAEELRSFEVLGSSDGVITAKITKLKPALVNFVTKERLEKNFADLIPEIILNKKKGPEKEGLIDKVRRNISRLIIVRKIDEKNPQTVDAIVVRIEKLLRQENYPDALGAALSLDPACHEIIKNFLDELIASIEVRQIDQEILNYLKSLS